MTVLSTTNPIIRYGRKRLMRACSSSSVFMIR